jgi:hypothetical protein
MWVARVLLPFFNLLHHAYDTNSWYSFPPGLGQYRLDSASLHYFPRLALQCVRRHPGQSDISNGKCVGMYHIAAYLHSYLISLECLGWLGSTKFGSIHLTFGFLERALFMRLSASCYGTRVVPNFYNLDEKKKKLRRQWKTLPTLIKEKEPLWYRLL